MSLEALAKEVAVLKWATGGAGTALTFLFLWLRSLAGKLKDHEVDVAKNYFSKEDGLRMKEDIIREISQLRNDIKDQLKG